MYTVNFIVYGVDTAEYRLKGKWTEATNNPCRTVWVGWNEVIGEKLAGF